MYFLHSGEILSSLQGFEQMDICFEDATRHAFTNFRRHAEQFRHLLQLILARGPKKVAHPCPRVLKIRFLSSSREGGYRINTYSYLAQGNF